MNGRAEVQPADWEVGAGARIVLASGSAVRKKLLRDAGLAFSVVTSDIDEDCLKQDLKGAPPADLALALAVAKAEAVAARPEQGDALVIGADQLLIIDDDVLNRPADLAEARQTLERLSGRQHQLVCGVALARGQALLWSHVSEAVLTVRPLSAAFLDRYLALEGDRLCQSVGAYRLEGPGIQLFSAIDGDYFSVLGLPLLPLLGALRQNGASLP